MDDGGIEVTHTTDNDETVMLDGVDDILHEIAEKAGFIFDSDWTTSQIGNKLMDIINPKKKKFLSRIISTLLRL